MAHDAIRVETRDHLLATLAEASELEHNLMCMYLFAMFSLKDSTKEDLSEAELSKVKNWRKSILDVAIQEMGHLALVANLTTAVGGHAHFHRNNFPVRPGHFPAEFVMNLRRFDEETLDHFIFLERPETEDVSDDEISEQNLKYERGSPRARIAAFVGDYGTVGKLYKAVSRGIRDLTQDLGREGLFCGSHSLQLGPKDIKLNGLEVIKDEVAAEVAIQKIIEQGEGAKSTKGSHFETFSTIRDDYQELLRKNPFFTPSRPTASNPVMRKPTPDETESLWVTDPLAAKYMDLSNALYNLLIRFLVQIYSQSGRAQAEKSRLLGGAFSAMHALSASASILSSLPATSAKDVNAGISFATNRFLNSYDQSCETRIIKEQINKLIDYTSALIKESRADFQNMVDFDGTCQSLNAIFTAMTQCLATF